MARTYAVWTPGPGLTDRPAAYARKVLLNRHRSLLRRAVVETRHLVASRPEDRQQPDIAGDDLVLWQALQHLPPRQRAAIVLRYYLDLPEAEVARLLGAPAGTVEVLDPPRPGPPARPPRPHLRRRAPRRQHHHGGRPMTIEDRVRRVLTEAVANEPPLKGAPLNAAVRRRRRRPVLAAAAALGPGRRRRRGRGPGGAQRAAPVHRPDRGLEGLHRHRRQPQVPLPAGLGAGG